MRQLSFPALYKMQPLTSIVQNNHLAANAASGQETCPVDITDCWLKWDPYSPHGLLNTRAAQVCLFFHAGGICKESPTLGIRNDSHTMGKRRVEQYLPSECCERCARSAATKKGSSASLSDNSRSEESLLAIAWRIQSSSLSLNSRRSKLQNIMLKSNKYARE